MTVVSNASPLIALSAINHLDLLPALYGIVYIPEAVYQEVVVQGAGRPGAAEVANAAWMIRRTIMDKQDSTQLVSAGLDAGESESIVLATELRATLLILDERGARKIARQRNLPLTGTVGVLVAAKDASLVAEIKPLLEQLMVAGIYINPDVMNDGLRLAGE